MGNIVFRYIAGILGFVAAMHLLTACSPGPTDNRATDTVYRLPWLDASGEYRLQDILLPTFQEPDKLRGSAAEIIVNPRVAGGDITGDEPIGRWIRDGSRWIPADFATMQAATVYAHLEKLATLDNELGVTKYLKGRERVGLLALVSDGSGGSNSQPMLNNAIYDGRLDAMFVVPYSLPEGLSIAFNAGIIGHEHFHRVFQAIVLNPIREAARNGTIPGGWSDFMGCLHADPISSGARPEPSYDLKFDTHSPLLRMDLRELVPSDVFNKVLVRAVNEGFADFWGWAYSNDDGFIARSMGAQEDSVRRLDQKQGFFPQKNVLRNYLIAFDAHGLPVVKSEGGLVNAAYRFGTEYARSLRGLVEALATDGALDRAAAVAHVRRALVLSLGDLSAMVMRKWGQEELDAEQMLKPTLSLLLKQLRMADMPAMKQAKAMQAICDELDRVNASPVIADPLCFPAPSNTGAKR